MEHKILKIALTGGIASGKTLVSDLLESYGCHIIDLDIISREMVLPESDGLKDLIEVFGKSILLSDGTLDRKYLRDVLFKKGRNRAQIEQILHPKILHKMKSLMDDYKEGIIIVVIPLLVEKELWAPFDRAIVVDCETEIQLIRLMSRDNIDKEKAKAILLAQSSREKRLQLNDYIPTDIIENNSKISELKDKVKILYQRLLGLL